MMHDTGLLAYGGNTVLYYITNYIITTHKQPLIVLSLGHFQ